MPFDKLKTIIKQVGKTGWRVMRALDREFNTPESYWVRKSGSQKVVVFVHGLLSESPRAWSNGETSWPELMQDDPDYADWDIVVANWYSTVMSEEHTIEMAADRLYGDLFDDISTGSEIVFICHSLGGVVVRQMLLTHPELVNENKVVCISLGTPAKGAKIASVLSSISKFFRHSQAQAVAFDSPSLLRIHEEFFRLVQESGGRLTGKEFYESSGLGKNLKLVKTVGRFGVRIPPLVSLESQGGYFGNPVEVPDTDHASISRPGSRETEVYELVKSVVLPDLSVK